MHICIVASLGLQEVCSMHHHHIILRLLSILQRMIHESKVQPVEEIKRWPSKIKKVSAVASDDRVYSQWHGEMEGRHIRVSRVNDKVVGPAHLQDTPEQNRVPVRPKAIDKHRNQIQQLVSIVVYKCLSQTITHCIKSLGKSISCKYMKPN